LVIPDDFRELIEEYRKDAIRIRNIIGESAKQECLYLKRFFDYFGPPDSPADLFAVICPDSVTRFLTLYSSTHGPGSKRWMQNSLRQFLRFAYRFKYLRSDISSLSPSVRSWRMGKIVRSIPPECVDAVISNIGHDTPADLRDCSIICLLSTYGIRGVQIRRLCLEDIDWANSRIHFSAVKGGRPVEQHLTAKAGNRLVDYITNGRPPSPCREVFLTLKKPFAPISSSCELSQIIKKRIKRAGVELPDGVSYGSHSFRHAFASRLYGRVPFKDVVDMLGHRDPSTTLIYGKVDVATLKKAALPWPGGKK
jgi:integrase